MRRYPVLLIGFTAALGQVILMREFLVVFHGNEVSLGLTLANWLFWTAIGSAVFGRLTGRTHRPVIAVAALEATISVTLPVAILALRNSRAAFHALPGEMLGPGAIMLTGLVALSVFCVPSGCLFAAASRMYAMELGQPVAQASGAVYVMEAMGAIIGGLFGSLQPVLRRNSFELAALLALLNLVAAAALAIPRPQLRRFGVAAILVIFALLAVPYTAVELERASLADLWHGLRCIASVNSIYGNLAVIATGDSRTLYENGAAAFTVPDQAAAEEAVHFGLLEHPHPSRVLLIGGGANGSLGQVLVHPSVERLDYVELDPEVLRIAQAYFADAWSRPAADPRVHIQRMDGRTYIKTVGGTYDVILLNVPDPQSAQLNRFYTAEFFREAAQRLAPGGLIALHVSGAEDYVSPALADLLRCIQATLRGAFTDILTIPGDPVHFVATAAPGVLLSDPADLAARLRSRRIETRYVREYYLPFRMSPERMAQLQRQLAPRRDTPINRDLAPAAFYLSSVLWSTRFSSTGLLRALGRISFGAAAAGAAVLAGAVVLWFRRFRGGRRARLEAGLAVASMGFTAIGLEVLLLLGFQALHGYVYQQVALITAGFMAGLAAGSWAALRRPADDPAALRRLASLQVAAAAAPLALFAILQLLASLQGRTALLISSQMVFPALAVGSGWLGGYQFPLASRRYFGSAKLAGPGALYGLDLAGSCAGALLFSLWLIPVFGFIGCACLVALINAAPTALLSMSAAQPSDH